MNKQWSDSAATVLWETFVTDFDETDGRELDTILTSPSSALMKNIRHLHIHRPRGKRDIQTKTQLTQLLCALTRNQLRSCTLEVALDGRTLGLLISCQKQLEVLNILSITEPPSSDYLANNMQKLIELTIRLGSDDRSTYGQWLIHTPNLTTLKLMARQGLSPFKIWRASHDDALLKLQTLVLDGLRVPGVSDHIGGFTHLPSLRDLRINNCENLAFLRNIAEELASCQEQSLKWLEIVQLWGYKDWCQHFDQFLNSFLGLEAIFITVSDGELPPIQSICRHGQTLSCLNVDPLNPTNNRRGPSDAWSYDASDLNKLVENCQNIEELGIDLGSMTSRRGMDMFLVSILSSGTRTQHGTSLAERLVRIAPLSQISLYSPLTDVQAALARLPKLQILCLTRVSAEHSNLGPATRHEQQHYAWCHQQIANEIMQFLAERGSPIQALVFSPWFSLYYNEQCNLKDMPDLNGHIWPEYAYVRGTTSFCRPRSHNVTRNTAVPVLRSDVSEYVENYRGILERPAPPE